MNATLPREQPGRTVKGHSAVLLPILGGQVDWQSFEKLLVATVESGIIPAVNMDTGYVQILTPETVQLVLTRTREILGPDQPFVAGAFVDDRPEDDFNADAYHRHIDAISREHALPIVFPSWGLCGHNDDEWLNSMTRIGAVCDRFLAFELSTTFVSYGRIVSLAAYESLLGIRQCIGAKHSSLERHAEWNRLVVRDRVRQEFIVLTGNDLAIDMIRWGSDFEGRTRLLCSIVERIRERVPRLAIGVRLSIFDTVPWRKTFNRGEPHIGKTEEYDCGFGINIHSPHEIDLAEPIELVRRLRDLGVVAVNLTAGSPYNSPHISRPALFPPSDGYPPPEDPLIGVARQIHAARKVKQAVEGIVTVGTAYTYLQEYLPHVAQATVRSGWIDAVGLGRMVLSYPVFPTDILTSGKLARTSICRTFSDCTSGPRNGLASGCYPLDEYYKRSPDGESLRAIKSRE